MINFYKYQGAGNDFIMIDNLGGGYTGVKVDLAKKLCDRHFGIGSDGLIFIESDDELDFLMDFYNPDGSQSFCGNGSRCAIAFAKLLKCYSGNEVIFRAIDGIHKASYSDGIAKVSMGDVTEIDKFGSDLFINTGSPHYIQMVEDLSKVDLIVLGRQIRYSEDFKKRGGTNVNFVQKLDGKSIAIRTYERGVENETLACGTGATAAALAFALSKGLVSENKINVNVLGGKLTVYFEFSEKGFKNIHLEGPAEYVFSGSTDG